jgi:hypothetical protein
MAWHPPSLPLSGKPGYVARWRYGLACSVLVIHAELARQVRAVCRVTGEFVLRSGRSADEYFDKYQFVADPVLLDALAGARRR